MNQPIQIELPTPFAVGPVNTYLFIEPEPTLVDCGLKTDDCWEALQQGLAEHDLTIADIKQVIITHAHVDHMGTVDWIAAQSQAQFWVSDIVYDWAVDLPAKWQTRIEFMDGFLARIGMSSADRETFRHYMAQTTKIWGVIPPERITTFAIDSTIQIGEHAWQVIYAPGHSNTQTCFYQPDTRQFLAADMLLHRAPTPVIEEPLDGGEQRIPGLPQYLKSLEMVEAMDIEWIYPGHGPPFTDHRQLIQQQRKRIQQRKQECHDLVKAGTHTVLELVNIMYSHYPPAARLGAMGMLVGYLDLLMAEGAVEEREVDGTCQYYSLNST